MQKKSEDKTRTSKRLFQGFTSRLTAYLKKQNDYPRYLSGKK